MCNFCLDLLCIFPQKLTTLYRNELTWKCDAGVAGFEVRWKFAAAPLDRLSTYPAALQQLSLSLSHSLFLPRLHLIELVVNLRQCLYSEFRSATCPGQAGMPPVYTRSRSHAFCLSPSLTHSPCAAAAAQSALSVD